MGRWVTAFLIALVCGLAAPSAVAQVTPGRPSGADSFAIGSGGTVCQAQGVSLRGERGSIYDRRWALLCRDVARPIGVALALERGDNGVSRLERHRDHTPGPTRCVPQRSQENSDSPERIKRPYGAPQGRSVREECFSKDRG